MDINELCSKAQAAYQTVYNQSEKRIVSDAMSQIYDEEDQTDYIESYLDILQKDWVDYGVFQSVLFQSAVDISESQKNDLRGILSEWFIVSEVTNEKVGTSFEYIKPKTGEFNHIIAANIVDEVQLPDVSESTRKKVLDTLREASRNLNSNMVSLVKLAPMLINCGIDYKKLGYPKLRDMISKMDDVLEVQRVSNTEMLVGIKGEKVLEELPNLSTAPEYVSGVVKVISRLSSRNNAIPGGWVDSVFLAPELRAEGIDYKKYAPRLKTFLQSMPDVVELNQVSATDLHVRLLKGTSVGEIVPVSNIQKVPDYLSPYEKLIAFAWFPPAKDNSLAGVPLMIQDLKTKALNENWTDENLRNYFYFTFERLQLEDSRNINKKKIFLGDKYAVFNTGLVNNCYEPIYALFKKNTKYKQGWVYSGFYTAYDRILSKVKKEENWNTLPKPAKFYDSPDDLIFDIESNIDAINWEHIIIDNIDRIPSKFIRTYAPQNFNIDEEFENPREYYEVLKTAVREDSYSYRKLHELFENALDRAVEHASSNYHYAIPMYYPRGRKVNMLLPLILEDNRESHVDLVMVLERDSEHNTYAATTIMTLKQVFCNVRLVSQNNNTDNWVPQIWKYGK